MAKYYLIYFIVIIHVLFKNEADGKCEKQEREKPISMQIKDHVLCDYDKTVRPVIDNEPVDLQLKFLVHHFEFLEHANEISVEAWIAMKWKDAHLTWDPKDFQNYEHIFINTDQIWVPDLSIYNRGSASDTQLLSDSSKCLLRYHNELICVSNTNLEGMCWPELAYWPFDVQNCSLEIGSWFHNGEEINVNSTEIIKETMYLQENQQWHLRDITITKNPGKYACCPNDTYPTLNFQFVISRQFKDSLIFIVVPYLVLISMTILTLWIDPESSERIYLTTINIPCHLLFLLNSIWEVPETANTVPYLIIMLRNSFLLASLTLIETLVVRCLLSKTKEVPRWLMTSFHTLTNNKIGQILLFSELDPENAAANLTNEDSTNLVEVKERPKEWFLLGKIIDRLSFIFYIFFMIIMLIICVPK